MEKAMAQNGWNEYSRLVLKELETLSKGISNLSLEIQDIKKEIAIMKDREDKVEELRTWKSALDEVISPSQLKALVKNIQELESFKTKAITIFAIIQFALAFLSVFARKLFGWA